MNGLPIVCAIRRSVATLGGIDLVVSRRGALLCRNGNAGVHAAVRVRSGGLVQVGDTSGGRAAPLGDRCASGGLKMERGLDDDGIGRPLPGSVPAGSVGGRRRGAGTPERASRRGLQPAEALCVLSGAAEGAGARGSGRRGSGGVLAHELGTLGEQVSPRGERDVWLPHSLELKSAQVQHPQLVGSNMRLLYGWSSQDPARARTRERHDPPTPRRTAAPGPSRLPPRPSRRLGGRTRPRARSLAP